MNHTVNIKNLPKDSVLHLHIHYRDGDMEDPKASSQVSRIKTTFTQKGENANNLLEAITKLIDRLCFTTTDILFVDGKITDDVSEEDIKQKGLLRLWIEGTLEIPLKGARKTEKHTLPLYEIKRPNHEPKSFEETGKNGLSFPTHSPTLAQTFLSPLLTPDS